jgi:hypothetical protein
MSDNLQEKEILTEEEAKAIEYAIFEDDEEIKLRDGKTYKIPPSGLKDARKLMQLLKTVNIDAIILNFMPSEDEKKDKQREKDLYEILIIAFKAYPEINEKYLEEYVDIDIASKIIEILIGLNGLKKSKPQQVIQE